MMKLMNFSLPKNKRTRMLGLFVADVVITILAAYLPFWINFDVASLGSGDRYGFVTSYLPFNLIVTILIFGALHLYSIMWSKAGIKELVRILLGVILSTVCQIAGMSLASIHMPSGYYLLTFSFMFAFESILRFSYKIWKAVVVDNLQKQSGPRILLIGAGEAGSAILRELHSSSSRTNGEVVAILDDDINKKGKIMNGAKVVGTSKEIAGAINTYLPDQIYVAIPSASPQARKLVIERIQHVNKKIKIMVLPGIYQLMNGEVSVSKLRDVQIEDLLGREPVKTDLDQVLGYIKDKVVLVTGGGGSIGSELSRQIASHQPKKLIVFDIYENNVYSIQQELKYKLPDVDIEYLIGSVRNTHRLQDVFETYHPDIVFHAAAHKHVPLMEDSPNEAIKNNVFGTYNTALMADKFECERFVLISTDKAVNPTNVMGATKRLCEMIIQMMSRHSNTKFVAVRFGNVLGSNGSVIPLFKKQIMHGGPVTVTDPNIVRFFMTIPEAVSLVLQAGAYAEGGEIFVLDMGEPVKIHDLAKNLIKLSGYTPDEDIKIEFTGLRPGEKLYEETLMEEEGIKDTPNKMIHIGQPILFNDEEFKNDLTELKEVAYADSREIRNYIKNLVPTYVLPEERTIAVKVEIPAKAKIKPGEENVQKAL